MNQFIITEEKSTKYAVLKDTCTFHLDQLRLRLRRAVHFDDCVAFYIFFMKHTQHLLHLNVFSLLKGITLSGNNPGLRWPKWLIYSFPYEFIIPNSEFIIPNSAF